MTNKNVVRMSSPSRLAVVSLALLFLAGCNAGKITEVVITSPLVCDPANSGVCGVPLQDPVTIEVRGQGVCSEFKLDLGYGAFPITDKNFDFSKGPRVYRNLNFAYAYPGPKTITAEGVTNCVGKVTVPLRLFTVAGSFRENLSIGIANPTQRCYAVPSAAPRPPLRKNTLVRITGSTSPKVSFGCLGGCAYDPDGKVGAAAPAHFPFPNMRPFSLVMVVGNQEEQGGTSASFTTNQGGDLLICQNDDFTYDNTGGWQVDIFVDESRAQ